MRKYAMVPLLLCLILLSACQNEAFDIEATSINVYENQQGSGTGKLQFTIKDQDTINDLLADLRRARTDDVSNVDMASPDFYLDFIYDEEVVLSVGYYTEPMDGARYLYKNKLYKVTTEIK
ncbi:hypothetical protein N780_03030 [Pontibacillus chungwhensis BH030062]|uniref:Lipoprotein n=1 Tax=Pontibacillus chungwhensis BH030062 TaxID=1385513 RepID=A0A0A2UWC6_9BACI|nr:hypothetical protein [Pontibacillus chungwhensis]KGP90791.1 hypothetical protein N780_03030 [Pontibacillus chungwhensis BH030062]